MLRQSTGSRVRLTLAVATVALTALPLLADDIVVDTLDGSGASDGLCSLIEAIEAAETDAVFGDCPAGSGWDRILFSVTGTISLTTDLPSATESLSIVGPGPDDLVVDGGTMFNFLDFGSSGGGQTFLVSGITLTQGRYNTSGGALRLRSQNDLTISESRLTDNLTTSGGGALAVDHNTSGVPNVRIYLERSTFSGNTAEGAPGGGAIRIGNGADVVITDCTISGNETVHANANGGAANVFQNSVGGTVEITRSTISGNSTQDEGGGISFQGSVTSPPQVSITSSTIVGNSAVATGGGLRLNGSDVTLANSVVADNTGTADVDIRFINGSLASLGTNFVGDNDSASTEFPAGSPNFSGDWVGTTMSPLDPDLAALAAAGGLSEVHLPNSGSPVLEVGACPGEAADQRGYVGNSGERPEDACDIGAVELDAVDPEPIFLSNFESGSTHRWSGSD